MSRKGNCWDNAPTESLWGRLKVGRLYGRRFAYDAHPIFSIDVLFDDRWASHLEDREAIDKWWFDNRPGEGAAEDTPQG
jgi:transposase InsO family protein